MERGRRGRWRSRRPPETEAMTDPMRTSLPASGARALAKAGAAALGLALGAGLLGASAQAADLCNNTNGGGVVNHPSNAQAPCVLGQSAQITQLITYHWNNGQGARPGTLALVNLATGQQYGPFAAGGSSGQGGAANVNWIANVNFTVPAGRYAVVDSDPNTWSWNQASGGYGFIRVEGAYVASPPPPPPPSSGPISRRWLLAPPTPSPGPATSGLLCNNTNTLGVQNSPNSHRTPCHLGSEAHVTQLYTYHWNNGHGASPGTIL